MSVGSTVSECDCATATLHSHPKSRADCASKQLLPAVQPCISAMVWAKKTTHTAVQIVVCTLHSTQYEYIYVPTLWSCRTTTQALTALQILPLAASVAMAAVERIHIPCTPRQQPAACSQVSYLFLSTGIYAAEHYWNASPADASAWYAVSSSLPYNERIAVPCLGRMIEM